MMMYFGLVQHKELQEIRLPMKYKYLPKESN
jgi:hypothetical protein